MKENPDNHLIEFTIPKPVAIINNRKYTGYGYTNSKKLAESKSIALNRFGYYVRVTECKEGKYCVWIRRD